MAFIIFLLAVKLSQFFKMCSCFLIVGGDLVHILDGELQNLLTAHTAVDTGEGHDAGGHGILQLDVEKLPEIQHKAEEGQGKNDYRIRYEMEDIKSKELAMGMVPKSELQNMAVTVSVPKAEPEMTRMEEIRFFLEGLFA